MVRYPVIHQHDAPGSSAAGRFHVGEAGGAFGISPLKPLERPERPDVVVNGWSAIRKLLLSP
jgi:hypothetical protein